MLNHTNKHEILAMTKSHIPWPHVLNANLWLPWCKGDIFLEKITLLYVNMQQLQNFKHLDVVITSLFWGHLLILENLCVGVLPYIIPTHYEICMVVRTLYGGKVSGPVVDILLIRRPIFEWYMELLGLYCTCDLSPWENWFMIYCGYSWQSEEHYYKKSMSIFQSLGHPS
jgi:hypothetical protein